MHPGSKNTDLSLRDSGKGAKLQFSSGRDQLPGPPVFSQSFLPTGTDDRGAAAGFMQYIDEAPAQKSGGAVGFLDLIDASDVQAVQKEKEEEEAWLKEAIGRCCRVGPLLENVTVSVQGSYDAWPAFVSSLFVLWRQTDESEPLVRHFVDIEVQNTKAPQFLFREDSVRVHGFQMYLLNFARAWLRAVVFKPVLSKAIARSRSTSSYIEVEPIALEVLKSMNEHVSELPSDVIRAMSFTSKAIAARFPFTSDHSGFLAAMFLFLRVVTPSIVDPLLCGLTHKEIKNKDTVLLLARLGRTLQKWVNAVCEQVGMDSSSTDYDDSEEKSSNSAERLGGGKFGGGEFTPRDGVSGDGEREVSRFIAAMYKTEGKPSPQPKPDAEEIAAAKRLLTMILRKNFKFLREAEQAVDRKSVIEKFYGSTYANMFSQMLDRAQAAQAATTVRLVSVTDALVAPTLEAENSYGEIFHNFFSKNNDRFTLNGERCLLLKATGLGSSLRLNKIAVDAISALVAVDFDVWFHLGRVNVRRLHKRAGIQPLKTNIMALFVYLAMTGRARFHVSAGEFAKGTTFFLLCKTENSSFAAGLSDKKNTSPHCCCDAMCSFMAGWCTEACGTTIRGVETTCVGKGDRSCQFVFCDPLVLESQAKRLVTEQKLPLNLVTSLCLDHVKASREFQASATVSIGLGTTSVPTSSGPTTPNSKVASSHRKSVPVVESNPASTPSEIVDQLRLALVKDAAEQKPKEGGTATRLLERVRSSSMAKKKRVHTSGESHLSPNTLPSRSSESNFDISLSSLMGAAPPVGPVATFASEEGEIRMKDHRYVLFRARDFSIDFVDALKAAIPSQQAFAPQMGASRASSVSAAGVCFKCGHHNKLEASSCTGCGTLLRKASKTKISPLPVALDPASPVSVASSGLTTTKRLSRALARETFPSEMAVAVAALWLYVQGLAQGDSLHASFSSSSNSSVSSSSSASLTTSADKTLSSSVGTFHAARSSFDNLAVGMRSLGWGELRHSTLGSFEDGADFQAVFRFSGSIEAEERVGSGTELRGSPVCLLLAGALAGFCSRLFGSRCACVELECSGCGDRECVFLCTIPSALVGRVKAFLCAVQKEAAYPVLFGGLGCELLAGLAEEDANGDATTPVKPTKKSGGKE